MRMFGAHPLQNQKIVSKKNLPVNPKFLHKNSKNRLKRPEAGNLTRRLPQQDLVE